MYRTRFVDARMNQGRSERGKRATFDRRSGAVHGSGSGAGGKGNPNEDYDDDTPAGSGAEPDGTQGPRKRDRLEGVHS